MEQHQMQHTYHTHLPKFTIQQWKYLPTLPSPPLPPIPSSPSSPPSTLLLLCSLHQIDFHFYFPSRLLHDSFFFIFGLFKAVKINISWKKLS
ncbi:hypothetical protein ES332_D10G279100v1 [Gossypium tomentosum]|uniref:Uncharacterized protein n=1 Tax=Gossypium tomentosum TaxID=34277 RepID=A0A5D2JA73_GOSTO|nr:hypothetical protein ES332_D10G279100v1 [Gossypium tomentosum]